MTSRTPVAAANWKMNLLRADAERFAEALAARPPRGTDVLLFPSLTLLPSLGALEGVAGVALGGQDLHPQASGAHTGDVSAAQLLDAGCSWALCGHSERRADHGESDSLIGAKLAAGLGAGLRVMLCLGESLEEREAGATFAVLERQLRVAWHAARAAGEDPDRHLESLALAYEPVWAIGTGKTATPELAQEAHAVLRRLTDDLWGSTVAAEMPILYGGSVKPANCRDLIGEPDIDGFLVGGASLDPASFLDIIAGCA